MASLPCNCSTTNPNNTPDPNIAGPGVIAGFILTGTLTFISSYITLWLRRKPGNQSRLLRSVTPNNVEEPADFWIDVLTDFVLQLSDQQLMLGLLLLVCAYIKYWGSSVNYGADNLWRAGDIVCFSSFTHAATLLTLRPYFRHHRRLATCRVIVMYMIYVLWLIVAAHILSPKKPKESIKKPVAIRDFWHAATFVEAFGIMGIYLMTYLPIFLSDRAIDVRIAVSEGSEEKFDVINEWSKDHRRRKSTGKIERTLWKRYSPYAVARRLLTLLAVRFGESYTRDRQPKWRRWMLWAAAELLFPWYTTGIILGAVWLFSLGGLILGLYQHGLTSSWDFGQLLPTFMVLLPFHSFVSAIAEARNPMVLHEQQPPVLSEDGTTSQSEPKEGSGAIVERPDGPGIRPATGAAEP